MLSHRGNVRTSKFWRKSKKKKRIFSKIYEGHIRIWFRSKKKSKLSHACVPLTGCPLPQHLVALLLSIWFSSSSSFVCLLVRHTFTLLLHLSMGPSFSVIVSTLSSAFDCSQHLAPSSSTSHWRLPPQSQLLFALFFCILLPSSSASVCVLVQQLFALYSSASVAFFLGRSLHPSSASDCPIPYALCPIAPIIFFLYVQFSSLPSFSPSVCRYPPHLVDLFLSICLPSSSTSTCPLPQHLLPSFSASVCPLLSHLVSLFLRIFLPCFSDSIALFLGVSLLPSSPPACLFPHHLLAFLLSI